MELPVRNYSPFEHTECIPYDIQFNFGDKARVEILILFDQKLLCSGALLTK